VLSIRRLVACLLALAAGVAVPLAVASDRSTPTERTAAKVQVQSFKKARTAKQVQRLVKAIRAQAAQDPEAIVDTDVLRRCRSTLDRRGRLRITTTFSDGTRVVTTVFCNGRVQTTTRNGNRAPTVVTTPGATVTLPVPGPTQVVTTTTPVTVPGPTQTVTTTVPAPAPAPKALRLTLLHNNDGESKLLTGDSLANVGGAARYVTKLNQVRQQAAAFTDPAIEAGTKAKGTVNVSSGDNFLAGINYQGSLAAGSFYDAFPLNRIGYDAVTLGNHEFDFGPSRLADFIEDTTSATFVSANLGFDTEPRLKALADQGRIRRSVVVDRGGVKIGIIGLTTPTLPSVSTPGNTVINANLAQVVNTEVDALEAAGVRVIVLSSHLQGLASEKALIPQIDGVDVVIAGGGDELLINGEPKVDTSTAFGPYPDRTVQDRTGRTIPIVTTQGEYRYVGRLTAEFDAAGDLQSIDAATSGPVRVVGSAFTGAPADAVDRDPAIVRQVDEPLTRFRAALDGRVIARSDVALDGRNNGGETIRRRETNLGNLVADSFLYVARRDSQARGRPLPDVALTNGGGIRNSNVLRGTNTGCGPFGSPFTISEGDTFRILAFDNTIVRATVDVPKLKELLEHGFASLPATNGRFPQIGGMRVVVDRSQPVGSRVRSVTLITGNEPLVTNGAVVAAPSRQIVVATTDFLAQRNGDGYPFNASQGQSTNEALQPSVGYQQALFRYLTEATGNGGLGGLTGDPLITGPHVTAAQYPFGTVDRTTITDGANPDTAYPACP
jgi:5'-nucleotidase